MKDTISKISEDLGLPKEVVKEAYKSFWSYIREQIKSLPLKEELTEEEFNNLQTNFNIPSIGKLSCTYDRYKSIKDRFNYIRNLKDDYNNKESKTTI